MAFYRHTLSPYCMVHMIWTILYRLYKLFELFISNLISMEAQ